ncbi:hypothetical protein Q31a_10130 [Aureliella helgolandensis]|uniref:Uncharacterized protein n=1 Tax=Aureliella helgolandensis TaxID=2527968 RepID=A0A518G274_9BACT|nr:hypothetical protein Q31a_10130 [Aureliella helgolandensis]
MPAASVRHDYLARSLWLWCEKLRKIQDCGVKTLFPPEIYSWGEFALAHK